MGTTVDSGRQTKAPKGSTAVLGRAAKALTHRRLRRLLRTPDAFAMFQSLATELHLACGQGPGAVLITSAQAREGRTTVAALYAILTAAYQPYQRVLLVDADFTRPALSRHFSGDSAPAGLAEFLHGQATFEAVVRSTAVPNLDLVATSVNAVPRVHMAPARFEAFLEAALREYDLVVIDAPPAAERRDLVPVAKIAHHAVVVVCYGGPNREQVQRVVEEFRRVGVHVLGAVLNKRVFPIPRFLYGIT